MENNKMILKRNWVVLGVLVLAILSFSLISAYARTGYAGASFSSLRSDITGEIGEYQTVSSSMCQAGQDFILQIDPSGCSPALARSDLLEEQNVPIFCPISATQLNPLIKVEAIDYVTITGQYPPEVLSVGFFPSRAASGQVGDSLNSAGYPFLDNIGYVVITLRKNPNESSMPDFVIGNLSAKIRYDVENAFGVGRAEFYLPVLNEDDWEKNKYAYGFWDGRGYLRAEFVEGDSAVISVYSGKTFGLQGEISRIANMDLEKGETSGQIYMPGFDYCWGGMTLRLNDVENPDTRARLNVNGDYYEVGDGEKFLDEKCIVKEVEKLGLVQKIKISCKEDEGRKNINLEIVPSIKLLIDNAEKDYSIGERLYSDKDNPENAVYLATIELKEEFVDSSDSSNLKVFVISSKDVGDYLDISPTELYLRTHFSGLGQFFSSVESIVYGETKSAFGNPVSIIGFANAENIELDEQVKKYYVEAMQDYGDVLDGFASEKYPENSIKTLGEKAFKNAISLAENLWQNQDVLSLCTRFNEQYPEIIKPDVCNNAYKSANTKSSIADVVINGEVHRISFEGIKEPGFTEYGAVIRVDGFPDGSKDLHLKKNQIYYLDDSYEEFIQLIEINDNNIMLNTRLKKESLTGKMAETVQSVGEKINVADIESKRKLEEDILQTFDSKYSFTLKKINIEKVAKVSIIPRINFAETNVEFPFKIGIDKRDIQLSPENIQSQLENVENTLDNLNAIQNRIEPVVEGFKTTCLSVGTFLTVKNFFSNVGGTGLARQKVMRTDNTGWFDICETKFNNGEYGSVDSCLLDNSEKIDAAVGNYSKAIENVNDRINRLEIGITDKNVLGEDVVDTDVLMERLVNDEYISEIENSADATIVIAGESQPIETENILEMINSGSITINQARDLLLNAELASSNNEDVRNIAKSEMNSILTNVYLNNKEETHRKTFADEFGVGEAIIGSTEKLNEYIISDVSTFEQVKNRFSTTPLGVEDTDFVYFFQDASKGQKYLLILDDNYAISDTYLIGSGNGLVKMSDETDRNPLNIGFKKFDAKTYENKYLNAKLRYYETGTYKGLPAIVPFDVENGWYASIKSTLPVGSNIASYDDSGRVSSFYLCNVGKDGNEEFNSGIGDDVCEMINLGTGQPYNQFPGLEANKAESLVRKAVDAVDFAYKRYSSGISSISIFGQAISVGEPYANIPAIQCQDFMSPSDCNLLFNVCDPVVCPSSRCDLGGTYPVADVVQSGIAGSLALCLPNFPEVKVPICLSGLNAGLEGWISVVDSYRQCLQESVDTGKTVGICDEIYSIHMCELVWRQGVPFAKILIPKLTGKLFGQDVRGGGEYLSVQNAFESAGQSLDYFTQYYAANSYKAFKARSTEEVASTEICESFVSLIVPSTADFLDNLVSADSPAQFYGRFDEIPFTTATNPPSSQYKVFYHIYAGKDFQAYYEVYLKGSGSSFYQDTGLKKVVARGFLTAGEYATSTEDFLAPSGYSEMCIVVNGQEECGFQETSTSFRVNYIKDLYINQQASQIDITSESECISGTLSAYSLLNPNLQFAAEDLINPEVYNKGLIRICATDNPGKGTDSAADTSEARWVDVGYCSDTNIRCWLDTLSVENVVRSTSIEDEILDEAADRQLEILMSENPNALTDFDAFVDKIKNIWVEEDSLEEASKIVIDQITSNLNNVFYNNQRAYLLLWRAFAYEELAQITHQEKQESERGSEGEIGGNICNSENLNACITPSTCIFDGGGRWVEGTCQKAESIEIEETPEEELICEDCGNGFLNTCDLQECITIRNQIGVQCVFQEGTWRNAWFNRCLTPVSLIEEETPEEEPVSSEFSCSTQAECQKVLGERIKEIALQNQDENQESRNFDEEVKSEGIAKSFECLILQIAFTESRIQQCGADIASGYQQNENPLYCENNFGTTLKSGAMGEESFGVMQINTKVHPQVDVTNFEKNVQWAVNHLIGLYNSGEKVYDCYEQTSGDFVPVTYSGWKRAIRAYNGWNTVCVDASGNSIGNPNYVDEILNVQLMNSFTQLFPECA